MSSITKNFSEREFACSCGCGEGVISEKLVTLLQKLRNKVGPITITSGIRCESWNKSVGGAILSRHVPRDGVSDAADITLNDRSNRSMAKLYICADLIGFKGKGLYARRVHVDMRPGPKKSWLDKSWSWSDT